MTDTARGGPWAEAATYLFNAALTVAVAAAVFHLKDADLRVPLTSSNDYLAVQVWVKSVVDFGWWMKTPALGAPGQLEMYDFPAGSNFHLLLIKVLAWFSRDSGLLVNLFYLLTFPLVALAAQVCLRQAGVGRAVAVAVGVLYAFAPFHLWRGVSHLFLSAYYLVPLFALLLVWLVQGRPLFWGRGPTGKLTWSPERGRSALALLIAAAVGADFPYYTVFAVFLLGVAGLRFALEKATRGAAARAAVLAAVTVVSFAATMAPHFRYWHREGKVVAGDHVSQHPWHDGYHLGLTVTQMMLPVPGYPVEPLKQLRNRYYDGSVPVSESDAMALGAFGTAGLLLGLVGVLAGGRLTSERGRACHLFGLLIVFAILLGTAGGFGTYLNLTGQTLVRSYNRISIFIAFFAVATAGVALDALLRRSDHLAWRGAGLLALAGLVWLGVKDQTAYVYFTAYAETRRLHENDADFFARVEQSVPPGTAVFQLPYIAYLSYRNTEGKMEPYEHFRGYLYTGRLHWSFGAPHGRSVDGLHETLAREAVPELLHDLALLDFGGVYVDRFGYADNGRQVEAELTRAAGAAPLVSRDGRRAFFPLQGYTARLRREVAGPEWQARLARLLARPRAYFARDFFGEERAEGRYWRWCGPDGSVYLENPLGCAQAVTVRFVARTVAPGAAVLRVSGPLAEEIPINPDGVTVCRRVVLPPGRSRLRFESAATFAPVGRERLVWGIFNFEALPE